MKKKTRVRSEIGPVGKSGSISKTGFDMKDLQSLIFCAVHLLISTKCPRSVDHFLFIFHIGTKMDKSSYLILTL